MGHFVISSPISSQLLIDATCVVCYVARNNNSRFQMVCDQVLCTFLCPQGHTASLLPIGLNRGRVGATEREFALHMVQSFRRIGQNGPAGRTNSYPYKANHYGAAKMTSPSPLAAFTEGGEHTSLHRLPLSPVTHKHNRGHKKRTACLSLSHDGKKNLSQSGTEMPLRDDQFLLKANQAFMVLWVCCFCCFLCVTFMPKCSWHKKLPFKKK